MRNQIKNKVWLKETGCMSKSFDLGLNVSRNIRLWKIRLCGKWKFKIERLTEHLSVSRGVTYSHYYKWWFLLLHFWRCRISKNPKYMYFYLLYMWVLVHCKMGSWNLQHHSINTCTQYTEEVLDEWPSSKPLIVCRYTNCIFSYGNYYYYYVAT